MRIHQPYLWIFLVLLFAVAPTLSQEKVAPDDATTKKTDITHEEFYEQFVNLEPRAERVAYVKDFSFRRDVATFTLRHGTLYLLSPVAGRTIAAFFRGVGSFSFTPPTKIEREQLYRFHETRSLEKDFKTLFLVFSDTTLSQLNRHLTFLITADF